MPSKKKKYNARFPPARIKKIMQTDEDVGKVAAAVPVIISRALELFIESLITKTSEMTKARNAKTLSTQHIKHTILSEKEFDFLKELVENIPDVQAPEEESSERSQPVERPPGSRPRGRPRKKPEDVLPPKKRRVKIQAAESSDDSETEDADSEIGENSDDTSSSNHSAMTSAAATSVLPPVATISPLAAETTQSQLLGPSAATSAPTSSLPAEIAFRNPGLPFTAPMQNFSSASTTTGLPAHTATSADIAMPLDMSVTATSKSSLQTASGLGQTADPVGNNTHPSMTTGAHMPRTLPAPMMSAPVIGEMPRFHPSLPFPPMGYGAPLPPHAHGPLAMPPMTGLSGMPVLPHHMYPPYQSMHNNFFPPRPLPGMQRYPPVCTVPSPVPTSKVTTAAAAAAAAGKADDDYDS